MKKVKEALLKSAVKIAEKAANMEGGDWWPPCIGYLYQPQRPAKKNCTKRESER